MSHSTLQTSASSEVNLNLSFQDPRLLAKGAAWVPLASSWGKRGTNLTVQSVEQRLGIFEVGGVEVLGEPVVDISEHRAGFVAATL